MSETVDLQQLAIEREPAKDGPPVNRSRLVARALMPAMLIAGFLGLVVWGSWDFLFPAQEVRVLAVQSTKATWQREGTPLFKAAGWIEPRPTPVRVAALAPGVVTELLVVEDQLVAVGEPVARLIDDDAKLALDRAQADFRLRQAELAQAEAGARAATIRMEEPVHLQAVLANAEAALAQVTTQLADLPYEIRQAEARQEFLRVDHQRKKSLEQIISASVVDEVASELEASKALVEELCNRESSLTLQQTALADRRDALQRQLELLANERQATEQTQGQVDAAAARVDQAAAVVAEAELRFERMTVRSPIEGRVYRLVGHPGAQVGSGNMPVPGQDSSTIVTLYRPELLQIRVDVRFEDVPHVHLGQHVEITNPALGNPLSGQVLFVSSEADIQKNTLEVKVAILTPPEVLKPEMLMDVTFLAPELSTEEQPTTEEGLRVLIPLAMVIHEESGATVWVADQSEHRARKVRIETGDTEGDMIEVTQGLNLTSHLIAGPTEELIDGQRIQITSRE